MNSMHCSFSNRGSGTSGAVVITLIQRWRGPYSGVDPHPHLSPPPQSGRNRGVEVAEAGGKPGLTAFHLCAEVLVRIGLREIHRSEALLL